MSHCAGDVWGHTLINEFAGGAWPDELFTIDGASIAYAICL